MMYDGSDDSAYGELPTYLLNQSYQISFDDQRLPCFVKRTVGLKFTHLHRSTTTFFARAGCSARAGAAPASRGTASSRFIFVAVFILVRKCAWRGSAAASAFLLAECACKQRDDGRKLLEALHDLLYLANVVDDAVDAAHPIDEALDVAHIVDSEPAEELA